MKTLAFALCATLCFAHPSLSIAQAAAPSDQGGAPEAGGPGGGSGAGGAGGGKSSKMKEAVKACRDQAKAQGVASGKDMKQAIMDCVGKQDPKMATVLKCRMEGKGKGLKPGTDEMKSFMKDCKKSGG